MGIEFKIAYTFSLIALLICPFGFWTIDNEQAQKILQPLAIGSLGIAFLAIILWVFRFIYTS